MSDDNVIALDRGFKATRRDLEAAARWTRSAGRGASAEVCHADNGDAYVAVQHRSDAYHVVQRPKGTWQAIFLPSQPIEGGPRSGDMLGEFRSLEDALEAIWPSKAVT